MENKRAESKELAGGMMADYQSCPGRTSACWQEMQWALSCGYIYKGYLYRKLDPPKWISWSFHIEGAGFVDDSPIRFCPFCGCDLDAPEE